MLGHAVFVLSLWCPLCVLRNWDIDGRVHVLTPAELTHLLQSERVRGDALGL